MAAKKKKGDGLGGIISRRARTKSFRKATKKLREKGRARSLLQAGERQSSAFGKERRKAERQLFKSLLRQR